MFRLLTTIFLTLYLSYGECEEKLLNVGNMQIWSETFGEPKNPALLLIMAAGGQGIMWPTQFCERLAKSGFYVIRYDHRDMGLSTSINYAETPYDLMDLSYDAIGILDTLGVQKAHLVGLSMGGSLAALIGKEFPDRVYTITMINSTSDLTTFLEPQTPALLPKPKSEYLAWIKERDEALKQGVTFDEKVALFVKTWRILNGSEMTFDRELYQSLVTQSLQRSKNPKGFQNHVLAMKASSDQLKTLFNALHIPTMIIHGSASPIFSEEHALDLAGKIPRSRLEFIQGMGHIITPTFYGLLETLIVSHALEHSTPPQ